MVMPFVGPLSGQVFTTYGAARLAEIDRAPELLPGALIVGAQLS